jgi:calreticulin
VSPRPLPTPPRPPQIGADKGIQTSPDARFYSLTAPLSSEIKNEGKDLVVSYTVRHDQNIDCGGAYLKLTPPGFDAKKFGGDTPYSIMFGPDICGTSTRKTHVIFTYGGKNLLTKKNVRMESDRLSHRYTLIVRPDNTYEVQIDGTKAESGSLYDDWDFLLPKKIKDPNAKKPSDWVDESAKLPDPNAKKPEDWDDEEDGEWTAPQIDNPEYKGVWTAKKIPNPAYKGPWVHPEIDNPEYKDDPKVHAVCNPCSHVGFELWQVKAGTIFDDIIVTDSLAEAEAFAKETFEAKKDGEKKTHDEKEETKRKKEEEERKKAEEASKAAADSKKEDEEEGEDEL